MGMYENGKSRNFPREFREFQGNPMRIPENSLKVHGDSREFQESRDFQEIPWNFMESHWKFHENPREFRNISGKFREFPENAGDPNWRLENFQPSRNTTPTEIIKNICFPLRFEVRKFSENFLEKFLVDPNLDAEWENFQKISNPIPYRYPTLAVAPRCADAPPPAHQGRSSPYHGARTFRK